MCHCHAQQLHAWKAAHTSVPMQCMLSDQALQVVPMQSEGRHAAKPKQDSSGYMDEEYRILAMSSVYAHTV